MAASAIDEALRNVVAVGGNISQTALLDNFCWGNTDKPDRLGGLVRAAQACYDMAHVFETPFISGKDRTQEEFFHTFNSIYESQKQIVITSDKFPKDIPNLEERLRSRFEWGLIADIQPPEIETKIAILRSKASSYNIPLPDDVAFFLASNVKSNIRELEGHLVRVIAFSSRS